MAALAGVTETDPGTKPCSQCEAMVGSIESPHGWYHDMFPGDICRACHDRSEDQQAKREKQAREQAAREAGQRALIRLVGSFPKRFRAATFDDLTGDVRVRSTAWLAGDSWLLFMSGVTGAGKTHAAYASLHQWAVTHIGDLTERMPLHYYAPDLYQAVRTESKLDDPSTGTTARLMATPSIVLIDDLGVGKPTEWAIQEMQRIIHHREQDELPTIVTTNLPIQPDPKDPKADDLTTMFSARFVRRLIDGIPVDMRSMYTGESLR